MGHWYCVVSPRREYHTYEVPSGNLQCGTIHRKAVKGVSMPFQPVPETAEFRMQFLWAGQQCENVFHVRKQGEWSQNDLNYIGEVFAGWWTSTMRGLTTNAASLQRVITRDISHEGGLSTEVTTGLPSAGTENGSVSAPTGSTVAVKWGTGLAGRGFRGRTYHIGLPMGALQNPTTLSATYQNGLRSGYDALRTALDNATLAVEFVVVSRWYNHVLRMPALTTPISGVSVDPDVDSQRRRLKGRGQ